MVWINFWDENKVVCSIGMVIFHVDSFSDTFMDYGTFKNVGEISSIQIKLQEKGNDSKAKF